ncbi:MAG TPA: response regulator [Polyangiaceae bacterium]|nr:response regulator [Polyangiaceae bacterium]
MVGLPAARDDEETRLTGARGEFVASLPRRLEVLRAGLAALADAPADRERLNGLLRRLHALGSAARVLGFASVAEVLAEAERTLRKGAQGLVLKEVARAFDLLPSLVSGMAVAPRAGDSDSAGLAGRAPPVSILVFGGLSLADAFRAEVGERFELEHSDDATRTSELARSVAPDAVIIDAEARGARELVEQLRGDTLVGPVAIVVVGNFAGPDAANVYVAAGADRVLSKPVSPETLRRTLLELGELSARPRAPREPVGELTVDELAERIASEVKKGLVESLELGGQSTRVNFGDGADVLGAVWGAVARVRELVTLRSSGNLRFQPFGPEGAIPLAPWMNDERRAGDRGVRHARAVDDVALKGRRIVVADDDPAVVWFLSGLLKAVGAHVIEAHDGERALERVFEHWPDLVVSDVLMPRRDGFSLCHEIKRDVVVRDVPVILLSWKEDLLQRVRELGAAADGYLRKEAAASTVVERVREVLRPRARIEQRLKVGGEVRGRLDGVTPRLVLELVSQSCPDATVTIRDAVYLYEAHLRAGRLRSLTRSAADGSFERGPAMLSALLGVSAGRFVVQPDSTPCRAEFDAALPELFEGPVRRARAALAALSAERLSRVVRVELELDAVRGYLECTPENARRLIERLAAGEAPKDLLLNGEASAWLLEAVLSDMARRGAVRAVERDPAAPETVQPTAAPSVQPSAAIQGEFAPVDSAWSEPPAAPEGSAPSNTRVSSNAVSDAEAVGTPAGLGPLATAALQVPEQERSVPLERESAGAAAEAAGGDPGWFSFQLDSSAPSGASASRPLPPVAPVPSSEEADSVFAALAEETADDPVPRAAPPRRDATPAGLGPTATLAAPSPSSTAEARSEGPQRVGVRPVLRMPPPSSERASPSMADVFAAALAEERGPNSEVTVRTLVQPTAVKTDPAPANPASQGAESAEVAADASQPEPQHSTAGAGEPVAADAAAGGGEPAAADAAVRPSAPTSTAESGASAPAPAAFPQTERSASPKSEPKPAAVPATALTSEPLEAAPNTAPGGFGPGDTLVSAIGDTLVSAVDAAPSATPPGPDPKLASRLESDVPTQRGTGTSMAPSPPTASLASTQLEAGLVNRADSAAVAEPATDATRDSSSLRLEQALSGESQTEPPPVAAPELKRKAAEKVAVKTPTPAPVSTAPAARVSRAAQKARSAEPTPAPPPAASLMGDGIGRTIVLALLAFGATYAFSLWVVAPALAPHDPVEPTPAPSAILAAARSAAPVAPSGPAMSVQNLDLPQGFDPGPSRGLLEVATAASDSIYVDGTFVGRGPGRSVPVAAGRHEVKIVRADAEHTTFVELTAGRRIRVGLELEPSAAPRP